MHRNREASTWGRFTNRADNSRNSQPVRADERMDRGEARDCVRANAVTPQPRANPSRNNAEQHQNRPRQGRRVSCAKRDQLHTEGKWFQCEQMGHSQRDCPELNMMRPPTVRINAVKVARVEHLSRARDRVDLQVGCVSLNLSGMLQKFRSFRPISLIFLNLCFVILFLSPSLCYHSHSFTFSFLSL